MKTRVLVVDDHVSLRQMLARLLAQEHAYQVVGEAGNGLEALRLCRTTPHDVLILDVVLPGLSGTEVLRHVRTEMPATKVLVYSGQLCQQEIVKVLRLKPHAYVAKTDTLSDLREALRATACGASYFSSSVTRLRSESSDVPSAHLSLRETQILTLVAEGHSTKEIASKLSLAPKTVEHHREHVMTKLNLRDITAMTRYAVRNGLVSTER